MRDPNRIYSICFQIAKVWHDNVPDWRFAQLFVNFISHMKIVNNYNIYTLLAD